jgi:hypothetical protein
MENNPMQEFIDQLIVDAGFGDMPEDFKAEYAERLTEEAHKRLGLAALAELDDGQMEEFEKLREGGNDELANRFLEGNIDDFTAKMSAALAEFRQTVLDSAKRVSGA